MTFSGGLVYVLSHSLEDTSHFLACRVALLLVARGTGHIVIAETCKNQVVGKGAERVPLHYGNNAPN